jgi:hypothetical protein
MHGLLVPSTIASSGHAYLQLGYLSGDMLHSPCNMKLNLQVLASLFAYKMAVSGRRLTRVASRCVFHDGIYYQSTIVTVPERSV